MLIASYAYARCSSFPLQATSHAPVMIAPMPAKRKNKNKSTGTGAGNDTGTGTATTSSVAGCDPAAIDPTCLQNVSLNYFQYLVI